MTKIADIFNNFSCFGFSGSRSWKYSDLPLQYAADLVPQNSKIFVGCAKGVDSFFRCAFPHAQVFDVSSGRWGDDRSAFAARSISCIKAVKGNNGLWVSFVSSPCPDGLVPSSLQSHCFKGLGSGSWASLALAVGLNIPSILYLEGNILIPYKWNLLQLDLDNWFYFLPNYNQLSLF